MNCEWTRSFDGASLNYFANHPDVRSHLGGAPGFLDLAPYVEPTENHFLEGEHGGLFFCWSGPDIYEVHIAILPEGRGKWAYDFARFGLAYMQEQGAVHLWARIRETDRHSHLYTLRAGFEYRGTKTFDIGAGPVSYKLFDWRRGCRYQ